MNAPANNAPSASAGADQSVAAAASVTLDASASADTDPGDSIASYAWTQSSGTAVTLSSTSAAQPTFTAPSLNVGDSALTLVFQVETTDTQSATDTDTVSITVNPPQTPAAAVFEAAEEDIQAIITQDASRSLRSSVTANQRMTQSARGRFISARQAQARAEDVTRALISFDVGGNFTLSESGLNTCRQLLPASW